MKFNTSLDLNRNQLLNAVIQNLAVAPSSPTAGLVYYNTALHTSFEWNGTAWIPRDASKMANGSLSLALLATDPLARANHTGTQAAATIIDLSTVVRGYTLNSFAAPTGNIAMNGFTFTGLSTAPNAAGQAAEYSWVMNQIQASAAGIDSKPSVVVLAAANIASISGLLIIDGVTLVAGDRVLLIGQTNAAENGPYIAAAGVWSRATDNITPQSFWFVEDGTFNKGSQWKVSTTGVITTGVTNLTIGQFGAANVYNAGNGLQLIGNTFSALLATNSGLQASGSGLSVLTPASSGILVTAAGVTVDSSIVAKKLGVTIGDGVTSVFTVTHNLGTLDVLAAVRLISTGEVEMVDQINDTVNTTKIIFAIPPATNSYRVSLIG